jgi:hypothetical protein
MVRLGGWQRRYGLGRAVLAIMLGVRLSSADGTMTGAEEEGSQRWCCVGKQCKEVNLIGVLFLWQHTTKAIIHHGAVNLQDVQCK